MLWSFLLVGPSLEEAKLNFEKQNWRHLNLNAYYLCPSQWDKVKNCAYFAEEQLPEKNIDSHYWLQTKKQNLSLCTRFSQNIVRMNQQSWTSSKWKTLVYSECLRHPKHVSLTCNVFALYEIGNQHVLSLILLTWNTYVDTVFYKKNSQHWALMLITIVKHLHDIGTYWSYCCKMTILHVLAWLEL